MSQNVPASFQVKFQNNVEMALQQKACPIEAAGAVIVGSETGAEKVKVKDVVGNTKAKEATERHGQTQWGNRTYEGIWIAKPNELYDADLVDTADQLATAISLSGTATMSAAATIKRARCQRTLEGFYGVQITGKTGTGTSAFPGSGIIPVTTGGASGAQPLNTKKLREANIYAAESYVDDDLKKFMVLTAEDNDALLDEVPATSSDFQRAFGAAVNDNGKLIRMLGWNFIHLELDNPFLNTIPDLATDGSSYRKTPFWVMGGLIANDWQNLRTKVGEIPERMFSLGYLAGTTRGATRGQDGTCGIILNKKN